MTEKRLTTQTGDPVPSNEHSLTVGADGPTVLHDRYLVEKLASFNRERVPERNPHAKGGGAFGEFEVTEDVSQFTRAKVFQPGSKAEVLLRFSSVAGEQGSPDTWRDVRGFALRFYTEEATLTSSATTPPRSSCATPSNSLTSSTHRSASVIQAYATPTCSGTSGHFHPSQLTR